MPSHPFERTRALRELASLAVACAIAAGATVVYVVESDMWSCGVLVGMPAFVAAGAWVVMMQSERRAPLLDVRWGWVLSVPLAMAWISMSSILTSLRHPSVRALATDLLRGTYSLMAWAPALLAVLVLFGIPLGIARSLAHKGLDDEERGDRLVGLVAFGVGIVSALVAALFSMGEYVGTPPEEDFPRLGLAAFVGWTLAAIGCGAATALLATFRLAQRVQFVARVRAGVEPGYRFETTAHGEEIVRVPTASTYRNGAREVVFESRNESAAPRDKNQASLSLVVIVAAVLMFGVAIIAVLVDGHKSDPCPPGRHLVDTWEGPQCHSNPPVSVGRY
ncbi:MAG TPA: hypothetical protein VGH28_33965 [Polyangiaceae bacterium]|jgi:hypothetical protein